MAQLGATMAGEVAEVEIELDKHTNQQTDNDRSDILKGTVRVFSSDQSKARFTTVSVKVL